MAPVTFLFAAAGIKIMCHYFLVNGFDLLRYCMQYPPGDNHDFFFMIFALAYRLNKIKYAYLLPASLWCGHYLSIFYKKLPAASNRRRWAFHRSALAISLWHF